MKVIKHKTFHQLLNVKSVIALSNYYMMFIKNGKCHNAKYYALFNLDKRQYYRKFFYFNNTRFDMHSIKQWIKKTKHLKRELKLKVFK